MDGSLLDLVAPQLDHFLRTDPRDVGCARAMELIHIYVYLMAASEPAEQRHPHR